MTIKIDVQAIRFPKLDLPNSSLNGLSPIVVYANQGLLNSPVSANNLDGPFQIGGKINFSDRQSVANEIQPTHNFSLNRVVFVVDSSKSMLHRMHHGQTKLEYLKEQLRSLPDSYLPAETKISLISFNRTAQNLSEGITNFSDLKNNLDKIDFAGCTNYANALREAKKIIKDDYTNEGEKNRNLVLFLSDGIDKEEKDLAEILVKELRELNTSTFFVGVGHDYNMKRIIELASLAGHSGWANSTVGDRDPELGVFNRLIPSMFNQMLGQEYYLKVQAEGDFASLSIATEQYRKALDPNNTIFAGYSSELRTVLFERKDNLKLNLLAGQSITDQDEIVREIEIRDSSDVGYLHEQLVQGMDAFQQVLMMEAILSQNMPMLLALKDFVSQEKKEVLAEVIYNMQDKKIGAERGNQNFFDDISQIGSNYLKLSNFVETYQVKAEATVDSGALQLHSGNLGNLYDSLKDNQIPPAKFPNAKDYQNIPSNFKPKLQVVGSDIEVNLSSLFNKKMFNIGRDRLSDLFLRNEKISRQHARIEYIDGIFCITDLNSKNGTYLNGKRLNANESMPLQKNDEIAICDLKLKFCI